MIQQSNAWFNLFAKENNKKNATFENLCFAIVYMYVEIYSIGIQWMPQYRVVIVIAIVYRVIFDF